MQGELVGDRHDLVRDDDGDAEGLGDLLELGQVPVQRLLALGEVAAALILGAEVRHDAVDQGSFESFQTQSFVSRLCDSHALTCVAMVFLTPLRRSIDRLKVRVPARRAKVKSRGLAASNTLGSTAEPRRRIVLTHSSGCFTQQGIRTAHSQRCAKVCSQI